jgi:NADH dehydrogenase
MVKYKSATIPMLLLRQDHSFPKSAAEQDINQRILGGITMNLVVGATGYLGAEVCRLLVANGRPARALVRRSSDPARVDGLRHTGVEIVVGDVQEPDSLEVACHGCTSVISTVSSMPFSFEEGMNDIKSVDRQGVANLIAAASTTGANRFIYTSFSGNMDRNFPLRNAKRATEDLLKSSDLDYTIVRPSYFMETWLSPAVGFNIEEGAVVVYGNGRNPISWVSFKDVARLIVACLDDESCRRSVIEMGGPDKLSPLEVIHIFEDVTQQAIDVTHVPVETLESQQADAENEMLASFAGLMQCYADGDAIDMEAVFEKYSFSPTSVKAYAHMAVENV